jgi:hypothetical protein
MQTSTFTIDTDRKNRIVRVGLGGQLAVLDVTGLFEAERAAVASMHVKMGQHLMLIDARELGVQSQAVVRAMQDVLITHEAARRIALVVGGALLKMQTKRVMSGTEFRIFDAIADAERWLLSV